MASKRLTTALRSEFAAARTAEARDRVAGLRAVAVHYHAGAERVVVELTSGYWLGVPVNVVPGLAQLSPAERAQCRLDPGGAGIVWNDDVDISVPGLLADAIGNRLHSRP